MTTQADPYKQIREEAAMHGLRRKDIGPCGLCGRKLMEGGKITAYRVRFESFVADLNAIQRAHGADMLLGPLGQVMGPDEPLMLRVVQDTALICMDCLHRSIAELMEISTHEPAADPDTQ